MNKEIKNLIAEVESYIATKELNDAIDAFIKSANTFECPEGYIFKDENDNVINATKIILEKKKKEYPKTYKECCDILGLDTMDNDAKGYKWLLIIRLQELLIARDAYWKIAGEEIGLGKSWEPDWMNENQYKYCIYNNSSNTQKDELISTNAFLAFPTAEMRDAFYDNFKKLIENCKELL